MFMLASIFSVKSVGIFAFAEVVEEALLLWSTLPLGGWVPRRLRDDIGVAVELEGKGREIRRAKYIS